MSWSQPKFDKFAFDGRRTKAVSATRTRGGWDTTGLSFGDFSTMHIQRREKVKERRLPTPKWSVRDDMLRELLVVHLEERFYLEPTAGFTLIERLTTARQRAEYYLPRKRELLRDWLKDYHTLCVSGIVGVKAELISDERAIEVFTSLKQIGGQLPLNADVARDYLTKKSLHDLEIQIQNIDTDIVLTERGHAEVIVAIVYLYYRLGWDSVAVAEQLGLKSPHVRQVLARLHSTWSSRLSHVYESSGDAKDQANLTSADVSGGAASPPFEPLSAIFEAE